MNYGGGSMYTIYLTTECNFRCAYCYEDYHEHQTISKNQILQIINRIFKCDHSQNISINFMGGEPLLKNHLLVEAVNYIKKQFPERTVRYHITTNCSLLDDGIIQFFKSNNFQLRLSFDGLRRAHDLNRICKNGQSCYDTIFTNVCKVRDSGIPYSVRMTIPANTIPLMYDNVLFLHQNGIDSINLIMDVNLDFTDELLSIFKEQMTKIKDLYIAEYDKGQKMTIDQFDGKFSNILCSFKNCFGMCDAGITNLKIMPNGDIYPCGFVTNNKEFKLCNITEPLDISYTKKIISAKFNPNNTKCRDCKIASFCQGMKCGFMNYIRSGYINVPSNAECQEEHVFYPLVVEIIEHFNSHDSKILKQTLGNLMQYINAQNLKLSPLGQEINFKLNKEMMDA